MDKKSKLLIGLVVLAVFLSVSYTFYKSVILKDIRFINTDVGTPQEVVETI
ncbi:hypothetical protein IPJ70_03610 [Candidatus Campbellbacteria bacterium]|nr:MAG: hypothetical protein IPJ70_03610 [Candidatus Campbellbacteria bacterium]